MSAKTLSPEIRKLIANEMAAGRYKSQDALLVDALGALADRRAAVEGIRRGLEDAQAGRQRTRKQFTKLLLQRHSYLSKS
jgi:predicted transcriptional regulator